jgi:hypothetical protein
MERQMADCEIFEATKRNCILHQDEARKAHENVAIYMETPVMHCMAVKMQQEAAAHHTEAYMRLERLIGTA